MLTEAEEVEDEEEAGEQLLLFRLRLGLVIFIQGWFRMFSMVGLSSGWWESIHKMRERASVSVK